jgi:hypothetical protein
VAANVSAANTNPSSPWLDDARRLLGLIEAAGTQFTGQEQHSQEHGQHPAECTWCPLCQALMLARRSGPELLDRVAEVAAGLAATLRQTQQGNPEQGNPERGHAQQGGEPAPEQQAPPRPDPPATVRIDISD